MSLLKKILLVTSFVFIIIQFIQPSRNKNSQLLKSDISMIVSIPDSVKSILTIACYDCHSNNTKYPWYTYIQPMGWIMENHIKKGKKELNFTEFGNYTKRKQLSMINGIVNSIKDGNMPLASYTLMHKDAQLSVNDKAILITWVQQSKDSISNKNRTE